MKSKDSGSYNGANRPVCFRNEETDTTVECGRIPLLYPFLHYGNTPDDSRRCRTRYLYSS